jgi:hypothetical protein
MRCGVKHRCAGPGSVAGVEHVDSDPVLAARHCDRESGRIMVCAHSRAGPRCTRDDGKIPLRPALMIRPFRPVRMKFNILNFILTDSSGPILLGSPDMERREAYRFLDDPDRGARPRMRSSHYLCAFAHGQAFGGVLGIKEPRA